MDSRFLESLINGDHKILGYKLHPYCFGDLVALEAVGSPVVKGLFFDTPEQIITFLRICSSKNPLNPNLKFSFLDSIRIILLRRKGALEEVQARIIAYLKDFASIPSIAEEVKDSTGDFIESVSVSDMPWLASRLASLHINTNLSDDEILKKPIGYLLWLDAAISKYNGAKFSIFDPENPDLGEDDIAELIELAKSDKKKQKQKSANQKTRRG